MTGPWVDLRHGGSEVSVLIENPKRIERGLNGRRYVVADLDEAAARRLLADLQRRVSEVWDQ